MNNCVDLDLVTLSRRLERREVSAVDVVEACLARIDRIDPMLNAFRQLDGDRPRDQAKICDARRERLGPLDGIPIAAKDNIDIEGLVTRSGLGPRDETQAKQDADIIRRLREAGAIILGHTNMHEAALGATTDNPHYGRTQNPWQRGYTPGGSSGGSAAAVAAKLCPLTLGTDTLGSIRLPAAYCGVAGYKPSHNLFANEGIEPLYKAFDQVGPIAQSVADLHLWYETMTAKSATRGVDLSTLRVGVLDHHDVDDDVRETFLDLVNQLRRSGVETSMQTIDDDDAGKVRRARLLLVEAEAEGHYRRDRRSYPHAFSESFSALLDYGKNASDDQRAEASTTVEHARRSFDAIFKETDLLLLPTTPQTAFSFDDSPPANQANLTAPANFIGGPAISLPIGLDRHGLPIGLQVMGAKGRDEIVLSAAAAIENMLGFRLPGLPSGDCA